MMSEDNREPSPSMGGGELPLEDLSIKIFQTQLRILNHFPDFPQIIAQQQGFKVR
jgi:hypothetical protein